MEGSREADLADLEWLVLLNRRVIAELAPSRGGAIWKAREARQEPIEDAFRALLADPQATVRVGTIDDVVIGYAVARSEKLADGSVLGVVDDIFVEEGARGIGVGEAMMDQVVAWCRDLGCIGIDAMALPGHRQTKNFFEDNGFTARQLVMHKRLESAVAND